MCDARTSPDDAVVLGAKHSLGDRLTEALVVISPLWMFLAGTVFAIIVAEVCAALVSLIAVGSVPDVMWLAAFVCPLVVASAELAVLIAVIGHLRRKNRRLSEAEATLTRDILARQSHESALQQAKQAAEDANAAKSRFLAVMSHEIRTPITSVLGMADLLYRTSLTGEQTGYLNILRSSTKTLLTILNDILDISKIEAGKVEIEVTNFNLKEAIGEVVELWRQNASAKGLKLELAVSGDVPAVVVGDPTRVKQVLFNLLSNSIKFTEQGSLNIRVLIKQEIDRSRVILIEVEDTGIGIARDQINQLFTAFSQADQTTTRRFGGTGLGLAISKKLVELMGGTIGIESELGTGALFWFTLPLKFGTAYGPRADAIPATSPAGVPVLTQPLRILLAEDNRINQMLVRSMLQKFGHTVRVVDNGRQALHAVMAEGIDVVLMDMQMPEMGGEEATRAIRALPSPMNRVPVLALTADVMAEHRERYLKAGVNELVPKPIDWQFLSDALKAHTGRAVEAKPTVTSAK
ncbi:MAG: response regulator [Alphaproteobacteria bacterium]|nr:response regulator [Alphaproteobacteria bacterium]